MRAAIIILAALGGCGAPAAQSQRQPAGVAESLSFEANSWGKPLSAWTIESSGQGRYTASKDAPSGDFHEYDLVTRSFTVSPADYRRVDALLRPARAYAGAKLPCELTVTDQVYGKARWQAAGGGEEIAFNLGCTSKEVAPLYENFWQAQKLVESLAGAGTIVETKEIRQPRP